MYHKHAAFRAWKIAEEQLFLTTCTLLYLTTLLIEGYFLKFMVYFLPIPIKKLYLLPSFKAFYCPKFSTISYYVKIIPECLHDSILSRSLLYLCFPLLPLMFILKHLPCITSPCPNARSCCFPLQHSFPYTGSSSVYSFLNTFLKPLSVSGQNFSPAEYFAGFLLWLQHTRSA